MENTENVRYISKEEEKKLYNDYKEAIQSEDSDLKKSVFLRIYLVLKDYIYFMISKKFPFLSVEDAAHEAVCEIYKNFATFDPAKGALLTWSKLHIMHALQLMVYGEQSDHYAQKTKAINKAIAEAERKGKVLSSNQLSEITGIPISTITKCLEQSNFKKCVFLDDEERTECKVLQSRDISPEESCIQNEEIRMLYNAINTLKKQEQEVIRLKFKLEMNSEMDKLYSKLDELSYREVAEIVGKSVEETKAIYKSAINKLLKELQRNNFGDERIVKKENTTIQRIVFLPESSNDLFDLFFDDIEDIDF